MPDWRHIPVRPRRVHPDGTGYERGLYTFDELPPVIANYIEYRFLQRADDLAYATLRKLLDGDLKLNQNEQSAWSRFIISLVHRSPEGIAHLKLRFGTEFRTEVEAFRGDYDARRTEGMPTFDEFIDNLSTADLQRMNVQVLQRVMDSQFLGAHLNSMRWTIVRFDETHRPLLTGDRPIVMTNGLNKEDSHLVLPISPKVLFLAANDQRQIDSVLQMAESAGLAQRMNNRIARQARKYVYAIGDAPLAFVAQRLGEKASWSPFE
jgi:Protein of unknown function (DUF4238)